MLDDDQCNAWHARQRAVPISTVLNFTADGLVLGAGTVMLRAEGPRRLQSLAGQEARILVLLSVAYGRAVASSALRHIKRAAKAWREGDDDCLAYVHLAHARLGELQCPRDAAQRLVSVDAFLKAGGSATTIFEALKITRSYIDAFEKDYNTAEPRVPAGSGRTSGQWTRDGGASSPSLLSYLAPGAASWLEDLSLPAAASLGEYALGFLTAAGGAVTAAGLLLIPSNRNVRVDGDVQGVPGLRYSWNPDQTGIHLIYNGPDGRQRTIFAGQDKDVFRDASGQVIGRILPDGSIVIDTVAVFPDLVKQGEPKLCPAYAPDVRGSDQGKPYEQNRARQYEDYMKPLINPDAPTPSGYVYYLSNPEQGGDPVSYDDCQTRTGILFDYKGERYAALLQNLIVENSIREQFLDKALRQVQASDGRSIVWIFAEPDAAMYAWTLFRNNDKLKGIYVASMPWLK